MPPYLRPRETHLEPTPNARHLCGPPVTPNQASRHTWSHYLCAEVRSDTVNGRWG